MPRRTRARSLLRRALAALLVVAVAAAGLTAAAPAGRNAAGTVDVWFLKGEQVVAIPKPGSSAEDAIRALLAGPTAAELKTGVRTYVPDGTPLRSVSVENGVATVDLGERFVQGTDSASLLARLSQVVHTLSGPEGATKVRLLIKGGTPLGIFPGAFAAAPIGVDYLEAPNVPPPVHVTPTDIPVRDDVRSVQQRLVELGYLLPRDVDGQLGPGTEAALIAFQKWEGLDRDGQIGPQTLRRLRTATRPTPVTRGAAGKRAEVLVDRQVALAIEDNQVVRAIHVSSGKPSTPTPTGDYRVYEKIARWWSVPFREWLLWASPFNGGIAFHEFPDVPVYAASHGCVRMPHAVAQWMYDFNLVGMPVKVIASSR
jgi:peptidoglycan hydrolase-like protein with peptidoglycan-binding domain